MNEASFRGPSRWAAAQFGIVTLAFLCIYWLASAAAQVHVGGDTTAYEEVARHQLSWHNIFSTQRPPIYPALIQLVDFSRPALVAIQFAAYVAAWIFLAAMMWRGNLLVAAAVYYVALYPGFAAWNHVLMTESLDISLSVAAFALLVRALDGRDWALWAFVAVMCVKCFLRGFDSVLGLVYLPILALAAALHRVSWKGLIGAAAAFAFCLIFLNRSKGPMADSVWFFALLNNFGTRVLPNPAWLQYCAAHGMPVNDALLSMTGHFAHEENFKFFNDPTLADFRAWLTTHGRATYSAYLLTHPGFMFGSLWQHRAEVFLAGGFPLWYYFDPGYRLSVPPWPPFVVVYALGTIGFLVSGTLLALRRVPRSLVPSALAAIVLWVTLLPVALAVFHADAGEISRHAVPLLLQATFCLLLMVELAVRWRVESTSRRAPRGEAGLRGAEMPEATVAVNR